jgi:hypothetical protein
MTTTAPITPPASVNQWAADMAFAYPRSIERNRTAHCHRLDRPPESKLRPPAVSGTGLIGQAGRRPWGRTVAPTCCENGGMDLRTRNSVTFVGRDDGRLVMLNPSPCYIDDADYRGGFRRADLDASMAPVILGNPDRPELGEELTISFCRPDDAIAPQATAQAISALVAALP